MSLAWRCILRECATFCTKFCSPAARADLLCWLRNFLCRCKSLKPRRSGSRCSLRSARDINLAALLYVASVMRIGLLALCHTACAATIQLCGISFCSGRGADPMHGALLRANAVQTPLLALHYSDFTVRTRLPSLRSRARCKWLRSATWRRQCESDCSHFVILCMARV